MKIPENITPFNTEFDIQKAYLLAVASKLAYLKEKQAKDKCKEYGFDKFKFIQNKATSTEAFVASTKEFIVVSFRGSQQLQDWFTDFEFIHTDGPLGRTHRGFIKAYRSIEDELNEAIEKCRFKTRQGLDDESLESLNTKMHPQSIWFTGHSLGAALATVAVGHRVEQSLPVDGLYTFGSPRVFEWDAATRFEQIIASRTFRFVNNADIVTRLPKRLMGYRHVGQLKYFDENGDFKDDPSFWERFLDRMQGRFEDFMEKGFSAIKDHDIDDYIKRCKKACDKC